MGSTTKLSFEEFLQIPEEPGNRFELDEGELIVEVSPTFRHNVIRDRIARFLKDFVLAHWLGAVTVENDFRLSSNVVRNPDVAFVSMDLLRSIDVDRSPIDGVPTLAVEVVSPTDSAADMVKKEHQYLDAGCQAVRVFYPNLKLVEIHDISGIREASAPAPLVEEKLFGGKRLSLPLATVFDEDLTK